MKCCREELTRCCEIGEEGFSLVDRRVVVKMLDHDIAKSKVAI